METKAFRKVLVAVNDSDLSFRALAKAAELAQKKFIDGLILINVWDTSRVDPTKLGAAAKKDELKARSMQILEQHQKYLKEWDIECQVVRAGGDAAGIIIDYAQEQHCDLIIMGSRKLNKFEELVLGSVSDRVTRLVDIPVLVIK